MNKLIYTLLILMIATNCLVGCGTETTEPTDNLDDYIDELGIDLDELKSENMYLSEELSYLRSQLDEAESRIEILEEYVDELEQLLEDNNVEGFVDSHGSALITKEK